MRTITVSSLFGLGALALFAVLTAGCPPSYFETCEGAECWQLEEDGGRGNDGGREASPNELPKITGMTIPDNPSRTIRQGFGGTPTNQATTVHLTGEHLDGVTAVTVGIGPDALNGIISSKSSTDLVFTVLVRHGAPIGTQFVKVTTPSATTTSSDAISITGITASPLGSDSIDHTIDLSGTDEHPFRSLTRATQFAIAGDTISLKNGIYDQEHGETFSRHGKNIPADVTIRGESIGGTILFGGPSRVECAFKNAFAPAGSARLENLVIRGFCERALVTSGLGTVTLQSVNIHEVGFAGVEANTDTILDSVDISETGDAIIVNNANLKLSHSRIHDSAMGILALSGTLTVIGSEIDHHSGDQRDEYPGSIAIITSASSTVLTDVHIHDNDFAGLSVKAPSNGTLTVTRGSFWGHREAIKLSGPAKAKIRNSTFLDSNSVLITLDDNALELDLGKSDMDPGDNEFRICKTCTGIVDTRPATSAPLAPIAVSGNTWWMFGYTPSKGCGASNSPVGRPALPQHWTIANPGSCTASTGNRFFN